MDIKQKGLSALAISVALLFIGFTAPSFADTSTPTTAHTSTLSAAQKSEAITASTAINPTTAVDAIPTPETPQTGYSTAEVKDPWEKFNRAMFKFNDAIDRAILKPIASLYNAIVPKPLNTGIHNFFNNLGEITTIGNDILQFNFHQMLNDTWRFSINSTAGIGGFFDPASHVGLKYYANDFGITMGKWGWRNSNYLVLPFFGPNTLRDGIELPVDYYAFTVYPYIRSYPIRYGLYGLGIVDRRAQLLQFQSVLDEIMVDKYVFTRNAYLQRRTYQIEQARQGGPVSVGTTIN